MQLLAKKIRELLNPEEVSHVGAKKGSEFLYDDQLLELCKLLLVDQVDPEDAVKTVLEEDVIDQSLYLAAVRLRVKAAPLAKEFLGGERQKDKALVAGATNRQLPVTFQEATGNIDDLIRSCMIHPENSDPMSDLAFLIEIQKRRLIGQLREMAKSPSAFLMNKQFNATVDSFKSLLKEMAQMQVDFGIRKRMPRQIDVRVQGAFQHFLESVGHEKDAVAELGTAILSILEDGKDESVDAEFSELN